MNEIGETLGESHRETLGEKLGAVQVSIVVPCLNEAESLPAVLEAILEGCQNTPERCEIVLADNGSTDQSMAIAEAKGARVIHVTERGYGAALAAGFVAARGSMVIMGDADGSYDFRQIPDFVKALQQPADIAQGCRLPAGGGRVLPGAMPTLHRWIGNPLFTALARRWMGVPVHDVYCGLRGFRRDRILALDLQCRGMEFAVEMLVRGAMRGYRFAEVPTTLSPDLRRSTAPHLRTFRDGWRTLRFLLLYSPRWLFLIPGMLLVMGGALAFGLGWTRAQIGAVSFDVHTMLVGSGILMVGVQALLFAYLTKVYGVATGLLPPDPRLERSFQFVNLERGLVVGVLVTIAGGWLILTAALGWVDTGLGPLDYSQVMRRVIPGVFLSILGVQGILFSWFFSILGVRRP